MTPREGPNRPASFLLMSSSWSPLPPAVIIQSAIYVFQIRIFQSSAITILLYDHLLTLKQEVALVWVRSS
ncbi:hypothetical protein M422DRAFT_270623 [Sphaerobolus stellatus SS14]|uniref:Unplaced genomic scaffold SPHSTscaffold_239, whole genome shotgun sequence n=1 Tax=Sphaerobolus stellatus (strain SS14) TaxID=990650 RepID=A0A0C9TFI3_SPHS4|nr:hypothetical protein M422DRAFT_270623 [Sphaerobolus stellatus SS14]